MNKPILIASSNDGKLVIQIGKKNYEYWVDAAWHPWIKKSFIKAPWKTLNFIKVKNKC